jgi:hypothetical protein
MLYRDYREVLFPEERYRRVHVLNSRFQRIRTGLTDVEEIVLNINHKQGSLHFNRSLNA